MSKPYIPSNDSEFNDFQDNINTEVTANGATWGIIATQITTLSQWSTDYAPLFLAIKFKDKRTPEQVLAHREYRKLYDPFLRKFCQSFLTNNINIPVSERKAMGLNPRGVNPSSERPKILTSPVTQLIPMGGGSIRFRFKVSQSNRVGRHKDSDGVEIFFKIVATGGLQPAPPPPPPTPPTPPTPPSSGNATTKQENTGLPTKDGYETYFSPKASFVKQLPLSDIGKTLYVYAQWVNNSNPTKSGPFSMVSAVIVS